MLSVEDNNFITNEEYNRKKRLLTYTIYITFPMTGVYAFLFYYNQVYFDSYVQMGCCLSFILLLWLLHKGTNIAIVAWIYIFLAAVSIYLNIYYTGGLFSVGLAWIISHPTVALLIGSKKHGYVAAGMDIIFLTTLILLHQAGFVFPPTNAMFTSTLSNVFSGFIGLFIMMFIVSLVFENGKNSALQKLAQKNRLVENERQRSDTLLLNILPAQAAEELKSEGRTRARKYEMASILFCDFVSFSKMAESITPEDLVVLIDKYFRAFDDIMDTYGIEKIKTVGDAYIAVSGVPDNKTHNPYNLILAAQEMLAFARQNIHHEKSFNLRIGINSGTIVTGVVGRAKFAYDIWGDAVNIAARLQQNCEENSINISESTYQQVQEKINCTFRGGIKAKNKGVLNMYAVNID